MQGALIFFAIIIMVNFLYHVYLPSFVADNSDPRFIFSAITCASSFGGVFYIFTSRGGLLTDSDENNLPHDMLEGMFRTYRALLSGIAFFTLLIAGLVPNLGVLSPALFVDGQPDYPVIVGSGLVVGFAERFVSELLSNLSGSNRG